MLVGERGRNLGLDRADHLHDRGSDVPGRVAEYVREREERDETAVRVVRDGEVDGAIAVRDELREAAPGVAAALQDAGIETVMPTGDDERTAGAVAAEVGVDEHRAELLPADRRSVVEGPRADGRVVAMVGDCTDDAPSLAAADVGVATGAAAIETADVAPMADDPERLPTRSR